MARPLRRVSAALLISILAAVPASADPIAITGGSLNSGTPGFDFRALFSLTVDGGTIEGQWPQGTVAAIDCGGCRPGTIISPNALWLSPEVPSELASPRPIGTVLGEGPFLAGRLRFLGDPLVIPDTGLPGPGGELTLSQPFTFSGWVAAYPTVSRGPFVPDPLIMLDLFGGGTAQLRFRLDAFPDGRPFLIYRDTTYQFEPTPEPLTLATVATGLGLMWGRRRRLRAMR